MDSLFLLYAFRLLQITIGLLVFLFKLWLYWYSCEENTVSTDFPARSPMEIREEQLKDEDLRKIIHCFENDDKDVNHANWLKRGYLTNQGVLYRNS
ncbi:hypothetical protein AVEN_64705-1 [Araneus ventricosus]|uniref:Uncharacterized protein n=1 Tax=Araneus ventricosus TaxID=182803 RepID=A0A4Y2Q3Y5_ARAVE|nr:hypothetical protein AVEN_64705-1 [Araneus ventricosus]